MNPAASSLPTIDARGTPSQVDRHRERVRLGRALLERGYRFTTVTPATQARVNARPCNRRARSIEDVFGWSRPFDPDVLPPDLAEGMEEAGVLCSEAEGWRSAIRASSLGSTLYLHSAYPTTDTDAVFFGPDTVRFAAAIESELAAGRPIRRAVDIGCGAGPGAITVALGRPGAEVVGVDINPRALAFSRINAELAGAAGVRFAASNLLDGLDGEFDLIVANPPYLLDPDERAYRHGGGHLGEGLSLAIADLAGERLAPGGRLLLYTGTAICGGNDRLRRMVAERLSAARLDWNYRELDPDVFGEELLEPAYADVDRIAAVLITATRAG